MRHHLVALSGLLAIGCAPAPDVLTVSTLQGSTMGTTYAVTVVGAGSPEETDHLRRLVDATLADVDAKMSTYDPDSELSRFNRSRSTDWVRLSPDSLEVFRHAKAVGRLTGGAFDVTVLPLVNAWGFGPLGPSVILPTNEDVTRLLDRVGDSMLELDEAITSIRKTRSDVESDLSALAKGYGVDRVADLLDAAKVEGYLVEVGGEVRTRGLNGDGRPWRVGVEQPVDVLGTIQRVVELTDAALATSGDYRNYFEYEGRRLSHTIDPRTGYPVDHRLASVSVVDELCVRADALATALGVLGPVDGFALAEQQGWAVLLVTREDDGRLTERATPQFLALSPEP